MCVFARARVRVHRGWLKKNANADVAEIEDKKSELETAELATGKTFEDSSETASSNRNIKRVD